MPQGRARLFQLHERPECRVDARYLAARIIEATGYNPAVLWRVEDAVLLRGAIRAYCSTREAVRHGHPVRRSMEHFWRKPIQ
jgi:hypothetical protein